jgi:Zn-finger nucleic acid-binding protein
MNCPGCGASMAPVSNRNHLHCGHCDGYYFPHETGDGVCPLGDPASVSCPTCRDQRLQVALIDGERVCYCDRCRGFLTKTATFGIIVTKRRAGHDVHEQMPGPFDPAELKRVLKCPNCKSRMNAHPYFGGGNAVVDTCDCCGLIWLDAGELAVIERYIPYVHKIEPALHLPGATSGFAEPCRGDAFPLGAAIALSLEDLL